ncbi:MAG: hypothetical protein ABTA23_12185 [Solibacillus sp.]
MAIVSGFHNSINGDRKYGADFFALFFSTLIANGVFPNPSTGLQVIANGNMTTFVKAGRGWINGYFIVNDGDYVLQHDNADGVLKRIDRVVMKLNHITRQIELVVKKGAFASTPVAPTLQRDADVYELALADVLINNGATQITQANITDQRLNSALCGIVHGTVNQVDTTTLFNQYQSWMTQQAIAYENNFIGWSETKREDFDNWLATIQDILDGNVAANLQNLITQNKDNLILLQTQVSRHLDEDAIHLATGTANAITISTPQGDYAYGQFKQLKFKAIANNTGNVTINVDGKGAVPALKFDGTQLAAGAIKANKIYEWYFDESSGGRFFLIAKASGNAVAGDVLAGKIFSNDDGEFIGTLSPDTKWARLTPTKSIITSSNPYIDEYTITGLTFIPKQLIITTAQDSFIAGFTYSAANFTLAIGDYLNASVSTRGYNYAESQTPYEGSTYASNFVRGLTTKFRITNNITRIYNVTSVLCIG